MRKFVNVHAYTQIKYRDERTCTYKIHVRLIDEKIPTSSLFVFFFWISMINGKPCVKIVFCVF